MSFVRAFDDSQIRKMTSGKNAELFAMLKADVSAGNVFPAVRKNELHFYYKGGRLYKFAGGSFKRDKNYEKFGVGSDGISPYEKAKREIEIKFTSSRGTAKERRILDDLNRRTFDTNYGGGVVVLDIEVNLNGKIGGGKKCDIVLLNKLTDELMFVEGKVFADSRVKVAASFVPEVISQVNTYTAAIAEQRSEILSQYANHIAIINGLFGTHFNPPKKLTEPAKLIVYGTPKDTTENDEHSINAIDCALGASNVLWVQADRNPALDEVWDLLNR